jgi:hypothetical protein
MTFGKISNDFGKISNDFGKISNDHWQNLNWLCKIWIDIGKFWILNNI